MIDARLTEVLVDKFFNVLRNRQKSGGSLNGRAVVKCTKFCGRCQFYRILGAIFSDFVMTK